MTDRLYELLPAIYRDRDAEQGYALKALLQVVGEQVEIVESDIRRLYENWFIETCDDWVVPYIGDLVGYEAVSSAGQPTGVASAEERLHNRILIPRREVANTIALRRRKGTFAVLETLARDTAGWPALPIEFYRLLGLALPLKHLHRLQGQTVDMRNGAALDLIGGPFDPYSHTVDVRGPYNIPQVGLYIWRLRSYSVSQSQARPLRVGPHCFSFSALGNSSPLYIRPEREMEPSSVPSELNLPAPIRRRAFEVRKEKPPSEANPAYYGAGKSVQVWIGKGGKVQPVDARNVIPADLSGWHYSVPRDKIAIDPKLGRIAFPKQHPPNGIVWVSYQYGFSADIGGGEYERITPEPAAPKRYPVGANAENKTIGHALAKWTHDNPDSAIIEILDSRVYVEPVNVIFQRNQTLQIQAGPWQSPLGLNTPAPPRSRPVVRILDWQDGHPNAMNVYLKPGCCFTLDGILVEGRPVRIQGECVNDAGVANDEEAQCPSINIRHCTLVPGWTLGHHCEPERPTEPSLILANTCARVRVLHSILGSIQVEEDEKATDPLPVTIEDSIVDSTDRELPAISALDCEPAFAVLTIRRCTILGETHVHAICLAENSIFKGKVRVARRQIGCMRFCYVSLKSRTPRRYECQPDLVVQVATDKAAERARVIPQFNSVRYGEPVYCQLAFSCAEEIKRGAEDESEMGVFHDLFQPQRAANLSVRLAEYTPAGLSTEILYAT